MKLFKIVALCSFTVGCVTATGNDTTPNVERDVANNIAHRGLWPWTWYLQRCNETYGHYCSRTNISELEGDQECKPVSVIYASNGMKGHNFGPDIGGLFVDEMAQHIGYDKFAVQGVDYRHGHGRKGPKILGGAAELVRHLNHTTSRCADTKVVLAAHMHGVEVVHATADFLTPHLAERVNAGKSTYDLSNLAVSILLKVQFLVVLFNDNRKHEEIKYIYPDRTLHLCRGRLAASWTRKSLKLKSDLLLTLSLQNAAGINIHRELLTSRSTSWAMVVLCRASADRPYTSCSLFVLSWIDMVRSISKFAIQHHVRLSTVSQLQYATFDRLKTDVLDYYGSRLQYITALPVYHVSRMTVNAFWLVKVKRELLTRSSIYPLRT